MRGAGWRTPLAGLLALSLAASGAASCAGPPQDTLVDRFEYESLPPVDIRVRLDAHDPHRSRYVPAIATALRWFGEWFGPYPQTSIALVLPVDVQAHRWEPRAAGQLERRIAARIANEFWSPDAAPDLSQQPDLREALIAFSVDRLGREAYAAERWIELRFFDDAVPWVVRGVPASASATIGRRPLLALLTMERYLGWPVLQQTLLDFRRRHARQHASVSDLVAVAGEVSGRDLAWMRPLFDASTSFDYGVDRIDLQPTATGTTRVDVVVRRYGEGAFSGSTQPRVGGFESAGVVKLVVTFADGQEMVEFWDGRDEERRFTYDSPVAVVSATLDPDRVIVVDASPANNTLVAGGAGRAESRAAAAAWALRWGSWLQDRMLLWSSMF